MRIVLFNKLVQKTSETRCPASGEVARYRGVSKSWRVNLQIPTSLGHTSTSQDVCMDHTRIHTHTQTQTHAILSWLIAACVAKCQQHTRHDVCRICQAHVYKKSYISNPSNRLWGRSWRGPTPIGGKGCPSPMNLLLSTTGYQNQIW